MGQKRFSLEGAEALIPLLDTLVEEAAVHGVREIVLGMAHRGRLNVLSNILGKSLESIFCEFEDVELAESPFGSGDVKYHKGYSTDRVTRERAAASTSRSPRTRRTSRPSTRSCSGRTRAKQTRIGDARRHRVIPVLAPRRRGLRGAGHRGRDAEPLPPQRLLDGRHDPRRREQPDRLHDEPAGGALDALLHRRRQDDPGADPPRERRRPRGGGPLRGAGARLPPALLPPTS